MAETILIQDQQKHTIWDNYVSILKNDRTTDVYLTEVIDIPSVYDEFCYVLESAYVGDTIRLHINNGGGSADSAFMIVDAMKNSKAHTIGKISGMVASASTIIAMYCDELVVADYSQLMIHNYFHGAQGTGNQVKEYVNFTDKEFTAAVKKVYAGFITPSEMDQVSKDDKELWFGAQEVRERWAAKKLAEAADE